jgi:hypothetical protein
MCGQNIPKELKEILPIAQSEWDRHLLTHEINQKSHREWLRIFME